LKLIIQIPCYNEAATLPVTLASLPREVAGVECVEWLVIDDGSEDDTAQVAKDCGVDYVVRHARNLGLARAFLTGLDACLQLGAGVIVNTDADNQYSAEDIPALVAPIIDGSAEIVVGARPIESIAHFSPVKKLLQRIGSWAVRVASNTDVPDAPSGFRAISAEAARRLMVFNDYTYTLETIIQAGQKNMAITSVPVHVNPDLRASRLVRSTASYIRRNIVTMLRIFMIYRPVRFFGYFGGALFAIGFLIGCRFLWHYSHGHGNGHVQSLILAAIFLGMGFQTGLVALLADLAAANRRLIEDVRSRMQEISVQGSNGTLGKYSMSGRK
jgi:glycosyltransferase involved in cell wall biosynthesis